jgi:hypothetical protein
MPAKFSVLAVTVVPFCTVALACGGDDGGGGGIKVVDAAMGSGSNQADAAGVTCYVENMYAPTFGSNDQFAQTSGSGASGSNAHTEIWGAALDPGMTPDVLQVELYAGFAAFSGTDIMPKTIQLSGEELNYKSCGACVRIFADATMDSSAAQYFATGGTVTLSSVQGTFMGTLSNVTLTKVTVADDFTSTPVGDGCTTTITSATMNAMLQMGSAAGPAPIERGATPNRLVLTQRHY